MRFHRLLALVREVPGGELLLEVGGPAGVLDSAQRYGLQLALFLPAIASERSWRLSAELVKVERGGAGGRLELTHEHQLPGGNRLLGYVPLEVRSMQESLSGKLEGWSMQDAPLLPLPSGELVVPDLLLLAPGRSHPLELFHRWHASALSRRLDQIEAGLLPGLLIGVDRALLRSPAGQVLAQRPELPAPRLRLLPSCRPRAPYWHCWAVARWRRGGRRHSSERRGC